MNKLIATAFVAASMLVGSAFAAQTEKTVTQSTDKTVTTSAPNTKIAKKHHHKHSKKTVTTTTTSVTPAK